MPFAPQGGGPALRPVIITRPAQQASALAQQIAARGRQPVIFPLLEILPLVDSTPLQAVLDQLASFALVVFVSPNAIDAAFRHIAGWPPQLPVGIVGEGSRAALARHHANPHLQSRMARTSGVAGVDLTPCARCCWCGRKRPRVLPTACWRRASGMPWRLPAPGAGARRGEPRLQPLLDSEND